MLKPNRDTDRTRPVDPGAELHRGQFGFRNRGNRTGIDLWDTYMEQGRAEGMFYKALVTLRLRTRNPAALILMAFGAALALMPVEFSAAELVMGVPPAKMSLAPLLTDRDIPMIQLECGGMLLLITAAGVLLLVNLALSLKDLLKPTRDQPDEVSSEAD